VENVPSESWHFHEDRNEKAITDWWFDTRLARRKRQSSGNRQTDREMYVKPYERPLMDIEAYRLHKQLYVYVSPIIIIVGVVGNLLSFIVLVQRPFRRISTYCYLIVLAVADTVVLTAGLLPKWIEQVGPLILHIVI